jgi:uncharacterized OsmC-like protein
MLLEALVACAGVTLKAVATALEISLKSGIVSAEGDLDFRGTLGVVKDAPVGFAQIRLVFDIETDVPQDKTSSSSSPSAAECSTRPYVAARLSRLVCYALVTFCPR